MARRIASIMMLCAVLLSLPILPVCAAAPDYGVPGRLLLPWACGEGHRVTWDPQGHWANAKATGVAWDFSMSAGTPLYAPSDGMAHFLLDERPFETNLGNYVELVVDGDWVVRLAHLRDAQSGERWVHAGELLGYSGRSGVRVEHLHLELLVRDGNRWGRPELLRIDELMGLSLAAFVQDAIITNDGCPAQVRLRDAVQAIQGRVALGDAVDLVLPLHNAGLVATTIRSIQVSLINPIGGTLLVEEEGPWDLGGKRDRDIVVRAWPGASGEWRVERVTCQTEDGAVGLPAEGVVRVAPSALAVIDISSQPIVHVGGRILVHFWVENTATQDAYLSGVSLGGARPDGGTWTAHVEEGAWVPARRAVRLTAHSATIPQQVGLWEVTEIAYQHTTGRMYGLRTPPYAFAVYGPELVVDDIAVYVSKESPTLFCTLRNRGTEVARIDTIEAWGWERDGVRAFSLASDRVAPIIPGESAYVKLDPVRAIDVAIGPLVEIGYWAGGDYYRMAFPE